MKCKGVTEKSVASFYFQKFKKNNEYRYDFINHTKIEKHYFRRYIS